MLIIQDLRVSRYNINQLITSLNHLFPKDKKKEGVMSVEMKTVIEKTETIVERVIYVNFFFSTIVRRV